MELHQFVKSIIKSACLQQQRTRLRPTRHLLVLHYSIGTCFYGVFKTVGYCVASQIAHRMRRYLQILAINDTLTFKLIFVNLIHLLKSIHFDFSLLSFQQIILLKGFLIISQFIFLSLPLPSPEKLRKNFLSFSAHDLFCLGCFFYLLVISLKCLTGESNPLF